MVVDGVGAGGGVVVDGIVVDVGFTKKSVWVVAWLSMALLLGASC